MDSGSALAAAASVQNGLLIAVKVAMPLLLAGVIGALVVALLKAVLRIEDTTISYAGRLVAIVMVLYFAGGYVFSDVVEYTERVWSGSDTFH